VLAPELWLPCGVATIGITPGAGEIGKMLPWTLGMAKPSAAGLIVCADAGAGAGVRWFSGAGVAPGVRVWSWFSSSAGEVSAIRTAAALGGGHRARRGHRR
jgi:hypothetical protein